MVYLGDNQADENMLMRNSDYKYKVTFLYPAVPKAFPIVSYARQGNSAFFYLKDLNQDIWDKVKKLAYSEQVHPCPHKQIVLKFSVKQRIDATWVEKKLEELNIKNG